MVKLKGGLLAIVATCLMMVGVAVAHDHGHSHGHGGEKKKKVGILLVAFGSSDPTAQVSFENIDKKVKSTYPGTPVRWAYTSHIIRKKMAKQGTMLDSPEVALAKMADEDFTHVAVQSLHTIAGAEYHELINVVGGFREMSKFEAITIGTPLLATQEDMEQTVNALLSIIPAERKHDEAVVFMGHGSHHPANAFYAALMFQVQLKDANVFIGNVKGFPELDTIRVLLKKSKVKKVYLIPFMSVAGDHTKNDMAGDENDSWKSILLSEGYEVVTIIKGTAEFDQFVDIWVSHLDESMHNF